MPSIQSIVADAVKDAAQEEVARTVRQALSASLKRLCLNESAMKIYIMTDLEGVAGVINAEDWTYATGRYYESAKELLTDEVNAAVDGFCAAGADAIMVADGHGPGAINPVRLDPRAQLMRGWPTGWPLLLDASYDAVAWVGQHAKAGTEYSHLTHTQSFGYIDISINGVSIGEFGQFAMCASELGVRSIFAAGERALCREAEALVPGIATVEVKYGTAPGVGAELDAAAYGRFHTAAVRLHPDKACALIRAGAKKALAGLKARIRKNPRHGLIRLTPPFVRVMRLREKKDAHPRSIDRATHPTSVIGAMNLPAHYKAEKPARRGRAKKRSRSGKG